MPTRDAREYAFGQFKDSEYSPKRTAVIDEHLGSGHGIRINLKKLNMPLNEVKLAIDGIVELAERQHGVTHNMKTVGNHLYLSFFDKPKR